MENSLVGSQAALSTVQGCLVVPAQADLYDDLLERIRGDVLNMVHSETVKGVVFDMSSVRVMDTYVFNHFVDTGRMTLLLGVAAVFVGFQPGVVSALVDLEIDATMVRAYRTIEEAVAYLTVDISSRRDDLEDEEETFSDPENDTTEKSIGWL